MELKVKFVTQQLSMHHNPGNQYQDSKRNFKLISILIGILLLVAAYKIYDDVFSPNVSTKYQKGKTYITVSSDKDFLKFLSQLDRSYVLINGNSFRRIAKLLSLHEKLKPGKYLIKEGMTNWDLLKMLIKGRQEPIDVVFKYAERKRDICRFFSSQLEVDSNQIYAMLNDSFTLAKLGFDTNTIISVFIPNTYNFYWNTNSVAVLDRMYTEYQKFWNAQRLTAAIQTRLTPVEVSILASIVQKESNKNDEMPVIAGVYLNRLHKGIPLQADPTVIYAWDDKNIRRVTSLHTSFNSPYNTYLNAGLPPGPICTPSIQAIDAVLNYSHHDYYYFCAREDFSGYHSFAETLEQHNQNARRYQRALNSKGIR